jgi:nucleoside-diphosphate-sugar epimerase
VSLTVTGARTELGRLLARAKPRRKIHINVAGQESNTLLHDGHAWKDFDRVARAGVSRALKSDATMLVHASFAFVAAEPARDPLRAHVRTILENEHRILEGPLPACVVRLGYLYGPTSANLRAYRTAFRLGRPYWAGPRNARQFHLYESDAVAALLAAADPRLAGWIFYATDGAPLPFMQFMDDFARRVGRRVPLHVPRLAAPLMRAIVRTEHVQQCELAMSAQAPRPSVPGWKPRVTDYRAGLDAVVAAWRDAEPA